MTCSFCSLDDKFLDQIMHMQSLKALSMQDYLLANVLRIKWINIQIHTFSICRAMAGCRFHVVRQYLPDTFASVYVVFV